MKLWILLITFSFLLCDTFAQVADPTPAIPQPGSLSPYQNPHSNNSPSLQQQRQAQTRKRNEALLEEANRQQYNRALEIEEVPKIQYSFPSQSHKEGTAMYYKAYQQITAMLEGKRPLSLKEAIFLTEHAFLEDRITKQWFDDIIAAKVAIIEDALVADGYEKNNSLTVKMMLHRFMSDTIKVCGSDGTVCNTSYPKRYDFTDIFGKQDWTKMFVTKLLSTNTGQCHSLPLLYLILAEELGVKAHLAFSPQHSYIKLQDHKGDWYNLELTNGHYSSDAWIIGSGYLKAETLSSGVYMEPLSTKETIANCLIDLAKGYKKKFGYDPFVLQCTEKALQYHPKNIFAMQFKSDYYTLLFQWVLRQLGTPPLQELQKNKQAFELYLKRNRVYDQIDATGYENMPEEIYKSWLKSLEQKKHLQVKFPRA